jgi:aspartyl-tRNA(Asn)/glutamyl-tRNA(Gln) amidotransferase subunit C
MKIDKKLIEHVARTARLKLTDKEINEFIPQLKEVLDAFSKLEEVDTRDVKCSYQPVELMNQFREDVVQDSLSQEDALKNTEHKKDGYFKGPKAV